MKNSQIPEEEGGEPSSPPVLPGCRDERAKTIAEIYVDLLSQRLDRLGGDMIVAGFKPQGFAVQLEASLLVDLAMAIGLIPESVDAERRSDPGNTD